VTENVLTLKHFFEEARAGRLTGIRCGKCSELSIPPSSSAPGVRSETGHPCRSRARAPFTSLHRHPRRAAGAGDEAPYAVAVVRLDEGVSLLGRIVDIPFDALRSGLPVRFRPLVKGEETALGFGPV